VGRSGCTVATQSGGGRTVGDLAHYLVVSRQNLSGLISRMVRGGHLKINADGRDRRSRLVTMTNSGRQIWQVQARPNHAYYERVLADFSINDVTHSLHYLLKMLDNTQRVDLDEQGATGQGGVSHFGGAQLSRTRRGIPPAREGKRLRSECASRRFDLSQTARPPVRTEVAQAIR